MVPDKQLPNSLEIEKAVIGSLLTDIELIDQVKNMHNKYFFDPNMQRCCIAIKDSVNKGNKVDLIMISQAIPDLEHVLISCMEGISTTANFDGWLRELKTLSATRQAILETYNFYMTLYETDDPLELISKQAHFLRDIYEENEDNPTRPKMLVKEAFSSGFYTYDYNVGGLFGGSRIVFKGAKNQGKTTLAKQMVYACAKQQIKSFYFSGERESEYEECDLALMGANKDQIQHRKGMAGRDEYYPTSECLKEYRDGLGRYIAIIDRLGAGKQDIFDYVFAKMEKEAKAGAKLFILDNMAVLNSANNKNKFKHQEEIISKLDVFKQKWDVDIVLITHPKKGKGFESTAGLGEIENLADCVIRFIRLTNDKHIVDTENYMLKSKALGNTNFPEPVKEKITAIMTFEKVKKGTKYTAFFEWIPERGISREVSLFETASKYQQMGYWVRHIHRMTDKELPEYLNK